MGARYFADGLQRLYDITILVAYLDFAVPVAFGHQLGPHFDVRLRCTGPSRQQTLLLTHYFVASIAADAADGLVDVENHLVLVDDHDALAGIAENIGGEFQLFLCQLALSLIVNDGQPHLAPTGVDHGCIDLDIA